jgi:hypothetical protein
MFFTKIKSFPCLFLSFIVAIVFVIKCQPFLFPLRVPIVFGFILFLFPFLANTRASALFQNLFFMRGPWQLASVTAISTMTALMVSFTSEQIFLKNPSLVAEISKMTALMVSLEIFLKLPSLSIQSWLSSIQSWLPMRYVVAIILVLPTWIFVWWRSRSELEENLTVSISRRLGVSGGFTIFIVWLVSILGGLGVSRGFIIFIVWLGSFLKEFSTENLETFQQIPALGQYISQRSEEDFLGFALGFCGLLIYVLVIYLFKPGKKKISFLGDAPALLYALLLIWILTGVLGVLTSNLDSFHFPVVLCLIGLSGLMYLLLDVDHYFKVVKIEDPSSEDKPEEKKDFKKAIKKRLEKQPLGNKTLVVVAASGGGIQAAGWTVQVLNGLQEELGPSFTQAIGLISSVSGGAVGTMFFLDKFDKQGFPPEDTLKTIFNNATEDCLDAVGWGLAYPDLVRIWFPPLAGDKCNDRGYAIEDNWKENMAAPEATLASRRKQILKGEIPIPVFNATLVEDGRRFLISPMTFIKDLKDANKRKAFDFNTLFECYDLKVTTAARLSASFPYVSPIPRNTDKFLNNYHVADGGYFDNSGMFTAVEWLDHFLDESGKSLNIKRILLLQINASSEAANREIKGDRGWFMAWLGPLQAMYSVRDSTLLSRNSKEIKLLTEKHKNTTEIKPFIISFPEGYQQPLSWKLTKQQKCNLKKGWEKYVDKDKTFKDLKKLWQETWGIPKEWVKPHVEIVEVGSET